MDFFANLGLGFSVAFTLSNLSYCMLGVFVGTAIGVLPGVGPLVTIAVLLPLTFVFAMAQTPLIQRHTIEPNADGKAAEAPAAKD